MSFVLAFLGFAALIILHELGHFTAAKAVGMRVERFSLFFPPLLSRYKRGETEYAVGAVPLGGYVKITGMNPAEEIPPEVAHRAYFRQPVWKRIVVIGAGPAVNIALAFLILWVLYLSVGYEGGPAIVHANGSEKWYVDGKRHREGAPACVYVNGTEKWYRHGLRHRDPDEGPAASYPDGRRIWFVDGVKVKSERVR